MSLFAALILFLFLFLFLFMFFWWRFAFTCSLSTVPLKPCLPDFWATANSGEVQPNFSSGCVLPSFDYFSSPDDILTRMIFHVARP